MRSTKRLIAGVAACLAGASCSDRTAVALVHGPGQLAAPEAGTDGPPTSDDAAADRPTDDVPNEMCTSHGYLHTEGTQIMTSDGCAVRLTAVTWFGFETGEFTVHGLWMRSLASVVDQIASLGYNAIRLPFSNQLFDAASTPKSIDWNLNPDLVNLDGPAILHKVVAAAGARGLRVIFDHHSNAASDETPPLWYNDSYDEQRFIDDWKKLATEYAGDSTVVAFDLHNEPGTTATWGDGNPATDWQAAAERAGNAVLAINPQLLIIVSGVAHVDDTWYWEGGNLRGVTAHPVTLAVPQRLVYGTHDYPLSVSPTSPQPWFSDPAYPDNLPGVWHDAWGFVFRDQIAPVMVAAFGTRYETTSDQLWLQTLAGYIGQNGLSFAYRSLNPESRDTGGILADDWTTVIAAKQAVLDPLLAPPIP